MPSPQLTSLPSLPNIPRNPPMKSFDFSSQCSNLSSILWRSELIFWRIRTSFSCEGETRAEEREEEEDWQRTTTVGNQLMEPDWTQLESQYTNYRTCAYFHKPNVEFLPSVAPGKVPPHVHIIVPHDTGNDVRCWHTLCTLCCYKLPHVLQWLIDVLRASWVIRKIIMCYKVDLCEGEEELLLYDMYIGHSGDAAPALSPCSPTSYLPLQCE